MSGPNILLVLMLTFAVPAAVSAQQADGPAEANDPARAEARRLLAEAQAHSEAGRHQLAARSYLSMYDVMRQAGLPRAPIALYSAGRALAEIPGREQEARETLDRFLSESTTLTDDPQVRDWRSGALEQITELDARIDASASTPTDGATPNETAPVRRGGGISPIGPIVLGVGGAALASGFITGVIALSNGNDLRAACGGSTCPASEQGRVADVTALSSATDALLFAGAAVAVVGLVLTLVLSEGGELEPPQTALACDERGCVAMVGGSF